MNQPTWREEYEEKFIVKWKDVDDKTYYRFNVDDFKRDADPRMVEAFIDEKLSQQRKEIVADLESMKRPCNCMTTSKKHAIVCSTQDTRQHKMETRFLADIITKLSKPEV